MGRDGPGKHYLQTGFMGRIFGKIALRTVLKDDSPLRHNSPSIPEFIVSTTAGDIGVEKNKWISLVNGYEHFKVDNFVHPFFGKMTASQTACMAYKHIDHHLRQFGA